MVICELRLQMRNLLIQLLSSALSFTAGNVSICRHGLCLPEQQTTFWRESCFGGVIFRRQPYSGGRQYFGVVQQFGNSEHPRGHEKQGAENAAADNVLLCLPQSDAARCCWLRQLCALPLASASKQQILTAGTLMS